MFWEGVWVALDQKKLIRKLIKLFGTTFPVITIKDIVKAQKFLIDHLGIKEIT